MAPGSSNRSFRQLRNHLVTRSMRQPSAQQVLPFPELLLEQALADLDLYRKPLPAIAYHYTNANGLIGILDGAELWASHVCSMNDRSEQQYALKPILRAFNAMSFKTQ